MSKEIRVIAWCDGKHDEDEKVQADGAVTLAFGRGKPRTVDLCGPCYKNMIEPVEAMFGRYGVTTDGTVETSLSQRGPRTIKPNPPCPDCGHQSPNRSALGTHTKNRHGKGLKDYPGL